MTGNEINDGQLVFYFNLQSLKKEEKSYEASVFEWAKK